MKNKAFRERFGFAAKGLRAAWESESSFRLQVVCGVGAIGLLFVLRPAPQWWALVILISGAVCAAELFNTSLEAVTDRLHPELHPLIARAKDCAAAAVLVLSLASLGVLAALLWASLAS